MSRRTSLVMTLAVGALTAGTVFATQVPQNEVELVNAAQVNPGPIGNFTVAKQGTFTPAKPTTVTPPKPVTVTPPKPVTVTPLKPGTITAKPVSASKKPGQFPTIQVKEITPTQATSLRTKRVVIGDVTRLLIPSRTPDGTCAISGGRGLFDTPFDFDVTGYAWYRSVPGSPGFYEWFQFQYKLDGLGVGGDHSNATIRMFEAGTPKFENVSPDDRRLGQWYYVTPTSPVYTRTTSSVNIDFTGTFDRSRRSDPSCTARTGRL